MEQIISAIVDGISTVGSIQLDCTTSNLAVESTNLVGSQAINGPCAKSRVKWAVVAVVSAGARIYGCRLSGCLWPITYRQKGDIKSNGLVPHEEPGRCF